MKILICGLNGAGKSTVASILAEKLKIKYLDIENYYFPHKNEYLIERSKKEVSELILKDFETYEDFVFCAVTGDYGKEQQNHFTHIIHLKATWQVRFKRIKQRSFYKFGNRMLKGGDLYNQEKSFFAACKNRDETDITDWLANTEIQTLSVDASQPIDIILNEIIMWVHR